MTPWGTPLTQNDEAVSNQFRLRDILSSGELIMLTLSGPDTYYDYHGRGMGLQYLLCEKFAQHLGVSLRVELCRDTLEMVKKLNEDEGDIIAFSLPKDIKNVQFCGVSVDSLKTQWAVKNGNTELADSLKQWFKPALIAQLQKEQRLLLSNRGVVRKVYSPMLNRAGE